MRNLIYAIVVATLDGPLTIREIAEHTRGHPETGLLVDMLVNAGRLSETWREDLNDYVYEMALEIVCRSDTAPRAPA